MSSHATFGDSCETCHEGVARPTLAWAATVAASGRSGSRRALANSQKCMACHGLGDAALAAHGVSMPGVAGDDTRPGVRDTLRAAAALMPESFRGADGQQAISCAACHREHEGRDHVSTSMTDAQCQVCHARVFDGFSGHPPFSGYPDGAQPMVAFDHRTHFAMHFAASARAGIAPPEDCSACHVSRESGLVAVRGFDACAACHEADIVDPPGSRPYLEVLAPPGLDLEALLDADIGSWPLYAESEPNAFLYLVLEAGGYLGSDDMQIVAALDLFDLGDVNDQQRQAVVRFAWAFKTMIRDLVRDGPALFVDAARTMHVGSASAESRADLAASLPFELARRAATQWFPALADELDRRDQGKNVPTGAIETDIVEAEGASDIDEWLRYGGWRLEELALLYRPTGHADRFLRAWMTVATAPIPSAELLFELLTDPDGPVACASCHVSRKAASDGASDRRLSWFARGAPNAVPVPVGASGGSPPAWRARRGHLVPFSHFSHRQAIVETGCAACHRVAARAEEPQGPSGFAPTSTENCAACHRKDTELADCVTCHTYHFGQADEDLIRTGDDAALRSPSGR